MENTFNPINTQEEFDNAIRDRLQRERAKFADYSELKSANEKLTADLADAKAQSAQEIADLTAKVKAYETAAVKTRIADEFNIPVNARDRLRGETEEEIRKDAEAFSQLFAHNKPTAPLKSTEQTSVDIKDHALKELAKNLFN